jgi:hypothetical protein
LAAPNPGQATDKAEALKMVEKADPKVKAGREQVFERNGTAHDLKPTRFLADHRIRMYRRDGTSKLCPVDSTKQQIVLFRLLIM